MVGAPLAAALLAMDNFLGLNGWQWLFLAEVPPYPQPPSKLPTAMAMGALAQKTHTMTDTFMHASP